MLLPTTVVMKYGPLLGVCVAISNREGDTLGHLFRSDPGLGMNVPPADVVTDPLPDPDFVNVTALTADGTAFLDLLRPEPWK